ncbi:MULTISPECIES: NAD-dependent epimerase/dehydratase family protein [Rheinheimera]|uniref:NAD-dependent epimerase/dehydratase family protein n=1 Tax=Rheinheimera marina TaxID=1774958 RepID=A0ABV9JNJ4_9GAMM
MKVIVVGAGWLARQLVQPLQQAGVELWLTSRDSRTVAELGELGLLLRFDADDLNNPALLQRFSGAVVLCLIPASRSNPALYLASLTRLCQLMVTAGSLACIHISSSGIYQGLTGLVNEEAELQLTDSRVALLYQAEQLVSQSVPSCTLRLAGLIGPGRHPGRFMAGKVVPDSQGAVNMVHSQDISRFIVQVLHQQLWPATYNLSSPEFCCRAEFYQQACAALGTPAAGLDGLNLDSRQVDSGKAMQVADFRFAYPSALQAIADC